MNDYFNIDLTELENKNYHGCNSNMLAMMTEAASVCFNKHNHSNPVCCSAKGIFTKDYIINYKTVDDSMLATYNDRDRAVEDGSYSIAFAIIEGYTGLKPWLKSAKGNGFDYHVGIDCNNIIRFKPIARLEVSGIFKSNSNNSIENRYKEKVDRLSKYEDSSPVYIVIVVYSKPQIKVGGLNV